MNWCYGWQNPFDVAGMHGRRWFSGMMPMHGWGGSFFMVLLGIIIAVGVVLLILRLLRSNVRPTDRFSGEEDRAIGILRERLARGEISQEEFEEKLRVLREEI